MTLGTALVCSFTGNRSAASGFLVSAGSLGSSGWLGYLDTPFHDDFESGQTDQFFFTLPNLGVINSVDVYFRPYGTGPDWYPLEISVTPMSTNAPGFHSYIDRWLVGEGWISLPA